MRFLERAGNHGVSAVGCARSIQWYGQWQRVDTVAATLRQEHPDSFRPVTVRERHGEDKPYWVFTTIVRRKRCGRKRLVMVHATAALSDGPRCPLTDAQPWESGRVIETWSDRWASEIFHAFAKQVTGLEAAQGRKEEEQHLNNLRRKDSLKGTETTEISVRLRNDSASYFEGSAEAVKRHCRWSGARRRWSSGPLPQGRQRQGLRSHRVRRLWDNESTR